MQVSISQLFQKVQPLDHGKKCFSCHLASCFLFHLLKTLKFRWPMLLGTCFEKCSVCFRLVVVVPSVPTKSNKLSLWSSEVSGEYETSNNQVKSEILATAFFYHSASCWTHSVLGVKIELQGTSKEHPGYKLIVDISKMHWVLYSNTEDTRGASG